MFFHSGHLRRNGADDRYFYITRNALLHDLIREKVRTKIKAHKPSLWRQCSVIADYI